MDRLSARQFEQRVAGVHRLARRTLAASSLNDSQIDECDERKKSENARRYRDTEHDRPPGKERAAHQAKTREHHAQVQRAERGASLATRPSGCGLGRRLVRLFRRLVLRFPLSV